MKSQLSPTQKAIRFAGEANRGIGSLADTWRLKSRGEWGKDVHANQHLKRLALLDWRGFCNFRPSGKRELAGFALLTTITLMALLLVIAVGMLSLSTLEVRKAQSHYHQQEAQANARMALMIALGKLQKMAGPDQRVTARAAIFEDSGSSVSAPNRNWQGVWKTTYTADGREWPLIGQATKTGGSPYRYKNIYSDLRQTETSLSEGKWREKLFLDWLVSRRNAGTDYQTVLTENDPGVVEMVGRGTLGQGMSETEYDRQRVLVEKIDTPDEGDFGGAYAWYVADENQKASINLDPKLAGLAYGDSDQQVPFLASQADNPELVKGSGGNYFANYNGNSDGNWGKIASYQSAALTADESGRERLAEGLGESFHDLTVNGSGLFTNVTTGGLRRDASPLLFGKKGESVVTFASPDNGATPDFTSENPLIPGPRKAVLGPSFGALRYWGQTKYLYNSGTNVIDAQVSHGYPSNSSHFRTSAGWNFLKVSERKSYSDGESFDGDKWASFAPKIHPVMTDARWHYYFSYTGTGASQNIRTHLIPRVCLWNPYNVTMKMDRLVVMMTNPLPAYPNASTVAFGISPNSSDEEKAKWANINTVIHGLEPGSKGVQLLANERFGKVGLFPDAVYLGFVLEATTLKPGECLVFSPTTSGAGQTVSASGVTIKKYDVNDISNNVLSASAVQGRDHFFHDYEGTYPGLDRKKVDFRKITNYGVGGFFANNRPFILKATPKGNWSQSVSSLCSNVNMYDPSLSVIGFPTLQLINNGNAGPPTAGMDLNSNIMGSAAASSSGTFGDLSRFTEDPSKDSPRNHQFGAKMLSLSEADTEASNFFAQNPGSNYAIRREWDPDHIAYNPATIANWNVRPGLVTRSPSATTSPSTYTNSLGAWMYQYLPLSPQDSGDMGVDNGSGKMANSPFLPHRGSDLRTALFDLPDAKYGTLSLGSLRHAQLSPYSWHPSYIVGNSLVNLHAPYETSAHLSQENIKPYGGVLPSVRSGFDDLLGSGLGQYGIYAGVCAASGLLQVGDDANVPTKDVEGVTLTAKDEIIAYDIAFEVNQNLWDGYFFSGMPISGSSFTWNPNSDTPLWNARYALNGAAREGDKKEKLNGVDGLAFGFWHNAYLLNSSCRSLHIMRISSCQRESAQRATIQEQPSFPALRSGQRLFQEPPAKRKFLAVSSND